MEESQTNWRNLSGFQSFDKLKFTEILKVEVVGQKQMKRDELYSKPYLNFSKFSFKKPVRGGMHGTRQQKVEQAAGKEEEGQKGPLWNHAPDPEAEASGSRSGKDISSGRAQRGAGQPTCDLAASQEEPRDRKPLQTHSSCLDASTS